MSLETSTFIVIPPSFTSLKISELLFLLLCMSGSAVRSSRSPPQRAIQLGRFRVQSLAAVLPSPLSQFVSTLFSFLQYKAPDLCSNAIAAVYLMPLRKKLRTRLIYAHSTFRNSLSILLRPFLGVSLGMTRSFSVVFLIIWLSTFISRVPVQRWRSTACTHLAIPFLGLCLSSSFAASVPTSVPSTSNSDRKSKHSDWYQIFQFIITTNC